MGYVDLREILVVFLVSCYVKFRTSYYATTPTPVSRTTNQFVELPPEKRNV